MENQVNIMEDDDPRIKMYREYYKRAKYVAERTGLDVKIRNQYEAKRVTVYGFDMVLCEDEIAIKVDSEIAFYFDPKSQEVYSADGGWMDVVNLLYKNAIEVDKQKEYNER